MKWWRKTTTLTTYKENRKNDTDTNPLTTYKENRKKWHRHKSPKGGWGPGSNEPTQTLFLLLQWCERKCTLVLKLGSKGLQLVKRIIFMWGEALFVFFFVDFVKICQSFPLFYCKPAKKNQQILVECAQQLFKSAFGKLPKFSQKILSNNWL